MSVAFSFSRACKIREWFEYRFDDKPDVIRSFARVFPRALGAPPRVRADTDARMCKGGSSLSLTSRAGGAPLADLNCTRRGDGDGTISCASITGSMGGSKKKEKNKRHTATREGG